MRVFHRLALLIFLAAPFGIFVQESFAQSPPQFGNVSFVSISGTPQEVIWDPGRHYAYVSNPVSNQVEVIDVNALALAPPIPVGNHPTGLALAPDGNTLLVTLSHANKMGVVDLVSGTQLRTIDLPTRNGYLPLRVDFASDGTLFWRNATTANPYGMIYTLDLVTNVSSPFLSESRRYALSRDRSKLLIMGSTVAQIWDANSQILGPIEKPYGFFEGNGGWITQGAFEDGLDPILMTRAGREIRAFNDSFNFEGFTPVGMGWGTFGPWQNTAIIVESITNEFSTNRISILNTTDLSILDTLWLDEVIGQGEYDFGSQAIALTGDGSKLLAVGQTGLYIVELTPTTPPNRPPDCRGAFAIPNKLWPPNHALVAIEVVGVVDPDDDLIGIAVDSVLQNEQVTGIGAGWSAPDAVLHPLAVRAESATGVGRVYKIAFAAVDGQGGSCRGVVTVCVPHDQFTDGCVEGFFDSTENAGWSGSDSVLSSPIRSIRTKR